MFKEDQNRNLLNFLNLNNAVVQILGGCQMLPLYSEKVNR